MKNRNKVFYNIKTILKKLHFLDGNSLAFNAVYGADNEEKAGLL